MLKESLSGSKPRTHRHSKPARLSPYLGAHMGESAVCQERERLKIRIEKLSGLCQQTATGCLPSPLCLWWHKMPSVARWGGRGLVWGQPHFWAFVLSSFGPSCLLSNKAGEPAGAMHAVTAGGWTSSTHTWVSPRLPHPSTESPCTSSPPALG